MQINRRSAVPGLNGMGDGGKPIQFARSGMKSQPFRMVVAYVVQQALGRAGKGDNDIRLAVRFAADGGACLGGHPFHFLQDAGDDVRWHSDCIGADRHLPARDFAGNMGR